MKETSASPSTNKLADVVLTTGERWDKKVLVTVPKGTSNLQFCARMKAPLNTDEAIARCDFGYLKPLPKGEQLTSQLPWEIRADY